MSYTLNKEQEDISKEIFNFIIKDTNKKNDYIAITGPAGSGKSYLINYIIDNVINNKYKAFCKVTNSNPIYCNNTYVTASTNKAVANLRESGLDADTIFKALNIFVVEEYGENRTYLNDCKARYITDSVIIIDECSMLNIEAMSTINKHFNRCKVIFIGDKYQLPPVNGVCDIFDKVPTLALTTIMRSIKSQPISELVTLLREYVISGYLKPIKIEPGVIDYITKDNLKPILKNYFSNTSNSVDCRIGTYTNKRCNQYISEVNEANNKDIININDVIYDAKDLSQYTVVAVPTICNSYIFTRSCVKDRLFNRDYSYSRSLNNYVSPSTLYRIHDQINSFIEDFLNKNEYRLIIVRDKINAIHFKKGIFLKNYSSVKTLKKSLKKIPLLLPPPLDTAGLEKEYYKFIDELINEIFQDYRPVFCSTLHKLQGTTLNTVVVDLDDLKTCRNRKIFSRLLYVGATRAKERVIFTGSAPTIQECLLNY